MKIIKNRMFFLVFSAFLVQAAMAQVKRYEGKVSQQLTVNSSTVIIDRSTRKQISYRSYEQLIQSAPGKYKLEPVFDKYGKASSFMLTRRTSAEAPQVIGFDEDLRPEVGEPLPPFVMQGLDGVTYDSEKLKGSYVLLGFWIRYEKPLYTLASTKVISAFVDAHRRRGIEIVSLGTTLDTREECLVNIPKRNCGFVPIPESFGFNHRYHIAETPFFILLDKQGNVMAMAPHTEFSLIGDLLLR
ncbi:hypothetical protein DYBT9275_01954 [Dyadobacter sp. CECT 9275]|uniref:Thioredoxin-like fold domain-containing protein n=1 Tax=Dyadobacter helix TaxID=2822344 RepID=A0A916NKZ1_9BACT|nr:thioredoxin-like domain-containing protein [Dyadobacter sp. CECT 9275]CAG4998209.1 hypothetical protein DYBT9275_01954 [Dyadobacter sp. CECT 9275]